MKKKIIYTMALAGLLSTMLMTSCKKKEEPKKEEPVAAAPEENGQSSTDSRDAQSENDAAVNDLNDVIGGQAKLHGRSSAQSSPFSSLSGTICGMTLDSLQLATGSVKLNYNGTTCANRTRTGSIRLTIIDYANGKRWKNVGCSIKVEYLAYKVTRASDGKSIQLDGTQYLTNESGGSYYELLWVKTQTTLVSSVTGTNLKVTFTDNKTAMYNINRRTTISIPNNVLTCKAEGIGTSGTLTGLENFGTTRDGDAFTSQVTTPIIWNLTCGWWAPLQGEVNMQVSSKSFGLKCIFGVDKNGAPVTVGANQCPFGWKLEWTYNSTTSNKLFNYN